MRGLRINIPETLLALAAQKRSVTYFDKKNGKLVRLAAAFVLGMPFKTVMGLLSKGLYVYEKED